jgi:hypothetical protein
MPFVGLRIIRCVPGRMSKNPITLFGLWDITGEERWVSSLTNWLDSLYNRINDP